MNLGLIWCWFVMTFDLALANLEAIISKGDTNQGSQCALRQEVTRAEKGISKTQAAEV